MLMKNVLQYINSITAIDDPEQNLQIQSHKARNEGMKDWLKIMDRLAPKKYCCKGLEACCTKQKMTNNFMALTIARVLGGDDENNKFSLFSKSYSG